MRGGLAESSRSFGSVLRAGRSLWRNCKNSGITTSKSVLCIGNGAGRAAPRQPPRARAPAEAPVGIKRPRTRVGSWAGGSLPRGERPAQASPHSSLHTQLLAFPSFCHRALAFKPHSFPCVGFPGSAEIKAAVSRIFRLRGNRGGCSWVYRVSVPAFSGMQKMPREKFPAVQSQGSQSILPAFPTPLLCRGT